MQMAGAASSLLASSTADQSGADAAKLGANAGILILPILVNTKGCCFHASAHMQVFAHALLSVGVYVRMHECTYCAVQKRAAIVLLAGALTGGMVTAALTLLDTHPMAPVPCVTCLRIFNLRFARARV